MLELENQYLLDSSIFKHLRAKAWQGVPTGVVLELKLIKRIKGKVFKYKILNIELSFYEIL